MKKSILTLFCCLATTLLHAENGQLDQDSIILRTVTTVSIDKNTGDTIRESSTTFTSEDTNWDECGSYVIDEINNHFAFVWEANKKKNSQMRPHWSGAGMGFMGYDEDKVPHSGLRGNRSHNFTLNLMSYGRQMFNSNFMLVTGLGFDWFRYHFEDNAVLKKVDDVVTFAKAPDGIELKSSKLLSYYVTIPLLVEFQTSDFFISAGAVLFFNYYAKSQAKYNNILGVEQVDSYKSLNTRPIDVRVRAQAGIDKFSLYGYYAPMSLFKSNKGPDLNTYMLGVMFNF